MPGLKTVVVRLDGNILYIEFPNEFTKDWVEARYVNPLQKTLRRVANRIGIFVLPFPRE